MIFYLNLVLGLGYLQFDMVKIKLNNINSTILYFIASPYLKETELNTFALFIFSKFVRH